MFVSMMLRDGKEGGEGGRAGRGGITCHLHRLIASSYAEERIWRRRLVLHRLRWIKLWDLRRLGRRWC
jgi:hypothetical protein